VKNIEEPIRAYLARPLAGSVAPSIPSIHRAIDAYLARRFHSVCKKAVEEITRTEALTIIEFSHLASLDDAPDIDTKRIAARLGLDVNRSARVLGRLQRRDLVERTGPTAPAWRLTPLGRETRRTLRPPCHPPERRLGASVRVPDHEHAPRFPYLAVQRLRMVPESYPTRSGRARLCVLWATSSIARAGSLPHPRTDAIRPSVP
jgi:DNA-binding MarR family transcriptional regulator